MRFRKSVRLGKGVKLNISKSGLSTTFGGNGMSLNAGQNGAYLNTGITGTGLYDRIKIGGNKMPDNRNLETLWNMSATDDVRASLFQNSFVPPYKTFGGILSFFLFIIGLPSAVIGLLAVFLILNSANPLEDFQLLPVFIPMAVIGILFYVLHFNNHRKAKKNNKASIEHAHNKYAEYQEARRQYSEAQQKILEAKLNAINGHELFDSAKVFTINNNNIIAFSKQRCIALFTEKETDTMKIIGVDHITKITQEIKSGDCYAHIFTDDFENNVYDLFIGTARGQEETEEVRKLYIRLV